MSDTTVNATQATLPVPRSPDLPRRAGWIYLLYGLILLGCGARIWEVITHNPMNHLYSDPLRHWDHASKPLEASPMAVFDPPLFQMWLSVVQKWSLGQKGLIALYASALSVLTPWLWYRFLREALDSKALALTGWAILVWLPTWIGIFDYFMTETLLLPLIGASLWATLRARRKRTVGAFIFMVVLWTLTGLTRAVGFPLGGLAAFWVWLFYPHKWRCLLASVAILLAALGPLTYRNYVYTHMIMPYGNGWLTKIYAESGKREILLNLRRDGALWRYSFTTPAMDRTPLTPFSQWTPSRSGAVVVNVDMAKGIDDWKTTLEQTAVHGAERWKLRGENFLMVMVGDSWPDNNNDYLSGRASIDFRWPWIPLFLLVMGVAIYHWRDTLRRPLLPVLITVWFVLQACSLVAVNEGRYRKPLEGLLVAQLMVLIEQRRQRRAARATAQPHETPLIEAPTQT